MVPFVFLSHSLLHSSVCLQERVPRMGARLDDCLVEGDADGCDCADCEGSHAHCLHASTADRDKDDNESTPVPRAVTQRMLSDTLNVLAHLAISDAPSQTPLLRQPLDQPQQTAPLMPIQSQNPPVNDHPDQQPTKVRRFVLLS